MNCVKCVLILFLIFGVTFLRPHAFCLVRTAFTFLCFLRMTILQWTIFVRNNNTFRFLFTRNMQYAAVCDVIFIS